MSQCIRDNTAKVQAILRWYFRFRVDIALGGPNEVRNALRIGCTCRRAVNDRGIWMDQIPVLASLGEEPLVTAASSSEKIPQTSIFQMQFFFRTS